MTDADTPLPAAAAAAARKPLLVELDEGTPQADPAAALAVPDAAPDAMGRAMQTAARLSRPVSPALRAALWVFSALFGLVLSVSAYDFVANLLARNVILGSIALVLTAVATGLALILALREWLAFLRLSRLDGMRATASTARDTADLPAARQVVAGLERLYAGRADLAPGLAAMAARREDVLDADALLDLAETQLLAPLDQQARQQIETAARQVATVTALVPMALADVATALFANLRMIRRIAEIYGGRAGALGAWHLLRRVFSYLVATGAVALTDDLIGSVAGGGVLSKLSRRFGEGVVNGALTARVGVAAMELCRPLPFTAAPRPKVTNLVTRALAGLFGADSAGKPPTG